MKRFFQYFAFLLITTTTYAIDIDSLNKYAGWTEIEPKISKQKLKFDNFIYSKVLNRSNLLFTADSTSSFQIWDTETGKLRFYRKIEHYPLVRMLNDSLILFARKSDTSENKALFLFNIQTDSILSNSDYLFKSFGENTNIILTSDSIIIVSTNGSSTLLSYPELEHISQTSYLEDYHYYFISDSLNLTLRDTYYNSGGKDLIINISIVLEKDGNIFKNKLVYAFSYSPPSLPYDKYYVSYSFDKNYDYLIALQKYYHYFNGKNSQTTDIYVIFSTDSLKTIRTIFLPDTVITSTVANSSDIVYLNNNSNEIIILNFLTNRFFRYPLQNNLGHGIINFDSKIKHLFYTSFNGDLYKIDNTFLNIKPIIHSDKQNIIESQEVRFSINSYNIIQTAQWDFGDGTQSNELSPKHIYKKSGSYSVKLIANDGLKIDTIFSKNYITVKKRYYPIIKSDDYFGNAPLSTKLQNVTVDFPDNIETLWTIDGIEISQKTPMISHIFEEGEHQIIMKFQIEQIDYSDTIAIEVFSKYDTLPKLLSGSTYGLVKKSEGYLEFNDMFNFEHLGNNELFLIMNNRYIEYYKGSYQFYSPVILKNKLFKHLKFPLDLRFEFNKIFPFTEFGYLQLETMTDSVAIFDNDNTYLYSKHVPLTSKNYALFDRTNLIACYDSVSIIFFNKYFEILDSLPHRELFDKTGSTIHQFFTLENPDVNLNNFILIGKFSNETIIKSFSMDRKPLKTYSLSINDSIVSIGRNRFGEFFIEFANKKLYVFDSSISNFQSINIQKLQYDKILWLNRNLLTIKIQPQSKYLKLKLYNRKLELIDTLEYYDEFSEWPFRTLIESFVMDNNSIILYTEGRYIYGKMPPDLKGFQHLLQFYFPKLNDTSGFLTDYNYSLDDTINYHLPNRENLQTGNVYPNPSNDFFTLIVYADTLDEVLVFDSRGTQFKLKYNIHKFENYLQLDISIASLPKGIYFISGKKKFQYFYNSFIKF